MPSFKVEHETQLPKNETYQKVQDYFKNSEGLRKLDNKIVCKFDDASCSGSVKGSKFECKLHLTGNGPTKVTLEISIPLMFTPFKGQIQEYLKNKMAKILG